MLTRAAEGRFCLQHTNILLRLQTAPNADKAAHQTERSDQAGQLAFPLLFPKEKLVGGPLIVAKSTQQGLRAIAALRQKTTCDPTEEVLQEVTKNRAVEIHSARSWR